MQPTTDPTRTNRNRREILPSYWCTGILDGDSVRCYCDDDGGGDGVRPIRNRDFDYYFLREGNANHHRRASQTLVAAGRPEDDDWMMEGLSVRRLLESHHCTGLEMNCCPEVWPATTVL